MYGVLLYRGCARHWWTVFSRPSMHLDCVAIAQVQAALKHSQDNHSVIRGLNEEIERASALVSASAAKESAARDQITTLKNDIAELTRLMDQVRRSLPRQIVGNVVRIAFDNDYQKIVFKINKGSKGIYIKDEEELENYIVTNNKEIKKSKKGSKEFSKLIENEKSKMSIQRFKGLGEMNPDELWSTTLNPETRNLLQVQYSKNSKKDQELIHTLMGNDVTLRKDFIISNAINVQNLDI